MLKKVFKRTGTMTHPWWTPVWAANSEEFCHRLSQRHICHCEALNDLDKLLWDAVCMLDDVPQHISIYRVLGLPKIDKAMYKECRNSHDLSIWCAKPHPSQNPHWLSLSWQSTTCSMWVKMALLMTLLVAVSREILR